MRSNSVKSFRKFRQDSIASGLKAFELIFATLQQRNIIFDLPLWYAVNTASGLLVILPTHSALTLVERRERVERWSLWMGTLSFTSWMNMAQMPACSIPTKLRSSSRLLHDLENIFARDFTSACLLGTMAAAARLPKWRGFDELDI